MDKQIAKAEKLLKDNKALTRTKFIKTDKTNQTPDFLELVWLKKLSTISLTR
jgi:hypothetical protein